jgi:hypothetical protein
MHPEPSGLVAGSRHHATFHVVPHSYRFALQFRVIALLYSREKLVHVHMDYLHSLNPKITIRNALF